MVHNTITHYQSFAQFYYRAWHHMAWNNSVVSSFQLPHLHPLPASSLSGFLRQGTVKMLLALCRLYSASIKTSLCYQILATSSLSFHFPLFLFISRSSFHALYIFAMHHTIGFHIVSEGRNWSLSVEVYHERKCLVEADAEMKYDLIKSYWCPTSSFQNAKYKAKFFIFFFYMITFCI